VVTSTDQAAADVLGALLELPCGVVLGNRLVKAAMSDSLGDGAGGPTEEQIALYRRWSAGGAALSLIGEVQVDHRFPEKPGNLVLSTGRDDAMFERLAGAGAETGAHVWPQLGRAGALADARISRPKGPSELDVEGLHCDALTRAEVDALPAAYAQAARRARDLGFGGVEIHAGHGFLLSQFLSPLFNHRTDHYGGSIEARCRLLVDVIDNVRAEVGPSFAIGVKINSSDQLEGGLDEGDALDAIGLLGATSLDLVDISGGTYFPGAPSSSDRRSPGPYFVEFARRARSVTDTALMVTGGFKTRAEAAAAISSGAADLVGLARTMALDPEVAAKWTQPQGGDPEFPTFDAPPPGGITAWFTMRLTALANGHDHVDMTLTEAVDAYESRDARRVETWRRAFEIEEAPVD